MSILLIAEHDNLAIKPEFYKVLSAACELSVNIDVLVVGYQCKPVATYLSGISQINKVLLVDQDCWKNQPHWELSILTANIAKDYTHVLCSSSSFGKAVMPRVAAYLDVAQISCVNEIISTDIFVRPIYAGRLMSKVKSHDRIKVITILTSSFPATVVKQFEDTVFSPIENITPEKIEILNSSQFISETINTSQRQSLQSADIVITAGRGLGTLKNVQEVEVLADSLDAAVGATRAVVDAGWMSNDKQIGQTAKTVAPDLYIALGVSGAAQHIAGMIDSKVIVAVNKDPDAPIFQIANYGLIGDLNSVLPDLIGLFNSPT